MGSRCALLYLPALPVCPLHLMPRHDLASWAAQLLEEGHWVRILDGGLAGGAQDPTARRSAFVQDIADLAPLDHALFTVDDRGDLGEAAAVARILRRVLPGTQCWLAGPFVEDYGAAAVLGSGVFDGALCGDVELALVGLANGSADRNELPNLLLRAPAGVRETRRELLRDLDDLPLPCYAPEVYPVLSSGGKLRYYTVEHSRGVYPVGHGATQAGWNTGRVRVKRPHRVREEFEALRGQHQAGVFHLAGAATPAAAREDLARELIEWGPRLDWSTVGHPSLLPPWTLALLARAGMGALGLPVESGSQRLLEEFHGSDCCVTGLETLFEACRGAGIYTHGRVIFPCPMDDYHTREETLRLLRRGRPDSVSLCMAELRPGSTWWQRGRDFGFRVSPRLLQRWVRAACASNNEINALDAPYRMLHWRRRGIDEAREALLLGLARAGIWHGASAQTGLMARLCGHESDEGVYDKILSTNLALGDAEGAAAMLREFNQRAAAPQQLDRATTFRLSLEAVGN